MNRGQIKIVVLYTLMVFGINVLAFSQSEPPVRIVFDEEAKGTDILSGREVPQYQYAQRGSIRFFRGRLDEPDDFVAYSHDGIKRYNISRMQSMEKIQKQFTVWRIISESGSKEPSPVHSLAVSFIPLSLAAKEPQERVYILLDDLKLIDWGNSGQ